MIVATPAQNGIHHIPSFTNLKICIITDTCIIKSPVRRTMVVIKRYDPAFIR